MINTCISCATANRSLARYCKKCGTRLFSNNHAVLDDLIGMEKVKDKIKELVLVMAAIKEGDMNYNDRLHTLLIGSMGTGKTKLVNILASLYYKYGVTKYDSPIVYDAVDFADFSKNFQDNYKNAKGNILCIENIQKLVPTNDTNSVSQIDRIFREMTKESNKLDPIVILSGQPEGLQDFLNTNDAIKSMFRFIFNVPDFDPTQLVQLTERELSKHGFKISDDSKDKLAKVFQFILIQNKTPKYQPEAINAWLALKMAEDIKSNYYLRVAGTGANERIITIEDIKGDIEESKTLEEVLAELDEFIGMQSVKEKVRSIVNSLKVKKAAAEKSGVNKSLLDFHILITGNPGTGKTSLARKLGEVVYAMGLLPSSTVYEIAPADVKGQYLGDAENLMNRALDQAMGGILFVDEAYGLAADQYGKKAAEVLMKRMTDEEGKILIIAAGYKDEIEGDFLRLNPGFPRRFEEDMRIHIDDYTPQELTEIFKRRATKDGYVLAEGTVDVVKKAFEQMYAGRTKTFGNAGEAVNLLKATIRRLGNRMATEGAKASSEIQPEDVAYKHTKTKSVEEVLAELDEFIGMQSVKEKVRSIVNSLKVKKAAAEKSGVNKSLLDFHILITGNPGTGKTSLARKLGEVVYAMGLLPSSTVYEIAPADVKGQYLGDAENLMNRALDQAMGGILFVDEAYGLAADQYGKKAAEVLMKRMTDEEGKILIIAAGYKDEIEGDFLRLNPGFPRRFEEDMRIHIDDYTPQELTEIFKRRATKDGYVLAEGTVDVVKKAFEQMYAGRTKTFGNAGEAVNLLKATIRRLGNRMATEGAKASSEIQPEDVAYKYTKTKSRITE